MATKRRDKLYLLVCGYVRNVEKEYKTLNIAQEINDIIYLYQSFCDEWSELHSSEYIVIDKEQNMITFLTSLTSTAFGEHIVADGTFTWRIKLIELYLGPYKQPPYVGIIKVDVSILDKFDWKVYKTGFRWNRIGYQLCGGNSLLRSDRGDEAKSHHDGKCEWTKPDDILEITLDLEKRELHFIVNDEEPGVWFSNIQQTKYRLALSLAKAKGSKFQFL